MEIPFDTLVLMERGDKSDQQTGTHEVLSLVQEECGTKAYPWTLFGSLVTHHDEGDAVVLQSRMHKHGARWSTGIHSEAFCHGRGLTLGVNIEMHNDYAGPDPALVIGLYIQASEGPGEMQYGIQVQDGSSYFTSAVGLNGSGATGVDLPGKFETGIHMHDNNIRLNEGACLELDAAGLIRVRYLKGQIDFLNGNKCFGHLDVNGEAHAL